MVFYYVNRHTPKLCPARRRIVSVDGTNEPAQRFFSSEQSDAAEQKDHQCQCKARPSGGTLQARPLFAPFLTMTSPNPHERNQEKQFCHQTDDAAARVCHYQGNGHQSGGEDVNELFLSFYCVREDQAQRQRYRQFHITCKVMAIDEWTKSLALRHFANPVNTRRTSKGLGQTENCQKKSEDGDCSDEQTKTIWRIDKHQC